MTGNSWSWKYNKKILSGLLIVGGGFLLLEHLFQFQGYDLEIVGHEILGLGMIAIAFLLNIKWKQLPAFLEAIKKREWRKVLDEGERI